MGLTDLFTSQAPPAVRKPTFTVQMGGGAAASGLGGLAGAVGDALGINLGGGADPWQEHVTALRVECGLAPFVDVAEIALAVTPQAPSVARPRRPSHSRATRCRTLVTMRFASRTRCQWSTLIEAAGSALLIADR